MWLYMAVRRNWKITFFRISDFEFFLLHPQENYVLEWMGLNFYDYDGLQPKMTHTKHSWGSICMVHVALLKRPINTFKPVQQTKKGNLPFCCRSHAYVSYRLTQLLTQLIINNSLFLISSTKTIFGV